MDNRVYMAYLSNLGILECFLSSAILRCVDIGISQILGVEVHVSEGCLG